MTSFQTALEQCTRKSWWGDQKLIKMSAPEAQAFTLKEAIRTEGRMLSMDDFKDLTGYTHGQVRAGLKQLDEDDSVYSNRIVIGPKKNIKFWGLK